MLRLVQVRCTHIGCLNRDMGVLLSMAGWLELQGDLQVERFQGQDRNGLNFSACPFQTQS